MIFLKLFWTFFRIGAFTFGGGYAMLPLIQEAVLANNWAEPEALINFIAVSESTPGPFAINMATYIGTVQGGVLGALCATLGVVTPSFIIILLVAKFFEKFKESKIVIETGADQVRIELEKWAISSNETAAEAAQAKAKKEQEAKAKAKAAKKAEKNK